MKSKGSYIYFFHMILKELLNYGILKPFTGIWEFLHFPWHYITPWEIIFYMKFLWKNIKKMVFLIKFIKYGIFFSLIPSLSFFFFSHLFFIFSLSSLFFFSLLSLLSCSLFLFIRSLTHTHITWDKIIIIIIIIINWNLTDNMPIFFYNPLLHIVDSFFFFCGIRMYFWWISLKYYIILIFLKNPYLINYSTKIPYI